VQLLQQNAQGLSANTVTAEAASPTAPPNGTIPKIANAHPTPPTQLKCTSLAPGDDFTVTSSSKGTTHASTVFSGPSRSVASTACQTDPIPGLNVINSPTSASTNATNAHSTPAPTLRPSLIPQRSFAYITQLSSAVSASAVAPSTPRAGSASPALRRYSAGMPAMSQLRYPGTPRHLPASTAAAPSSSGPPSPTPSTSSVTGPAPGGKTEHETRLLHRRLEHHTREIQDLRKKVRHCCLVRRLYYVHTDMLCPDQ
jgi:hypothetical protein